MKKNGLSTPPVSATSMAAPVSATDPSTTNFAEPRAFGGKTSLTRIRNDPGQGKQDQDRLLRLGPQARAQHDRRRDQDEDPADDADDAVVRRRGPVAIGDRSSSVPVTAAAASRPSRSAPGARSSDASPGPTEQRDQDHAEHDQVPDERDEQ